MEDSGENVHCMEFSTAPFDIVLTQVEDKEEPEVPCEVAPPSPPPPPIVAKRIRSIFPEDERRRRKEETGETKKLNRKIKSLEEKVEGLKAQKNKILIADKKFKGEIASLKRTNKALFARLVAA